MVRVAIAILISVLLASTAHAKRVALVVSINKYDNLPRDRQLAKAVNGARAMEAALKVVGVAPSPSPRRPPRSPRDSPPWMLLRF